MLYTIVGGDLRNIELGRLLAQDGNDVYMLGFAKEMVPSNVSTSSIDNISNSHVIIAPLVLSYDDENINTPYSDKAIKIIDVLNHLQPNQLFILGKPSVRVKKIMEDLSLQYRDILQREEMAILNAIPTAEGAIQSAIENTTTTLHGSNCMILGFGRIGKVLSKILSAMGANVYVMARKEKDLAWIFAYGYNRIHPGALKETVPLVDVIFNTVPSVILNYDVLSTLKKDVLIIDLASWPYGVNKDDAEKLGINVKFLPGLPGRIAPKTCAGFMKNTIYNIIGEMEV
ncbi:MAG: dipicolinate synthase subunit DpsA [Clostridiales bacterium]|nr:dipicolinate synthase subunit DpsA [Clostridiales bacterium]